MDQIASIIAESEVSSRGVLVFGLIGIVVAFAVMMVAEVAIDALIKRFPEGPGIMMGAGAVSLVLASILSSSFFGILGALLLGIPVLLMIFDRHHVRDKWDRP
ncbi:hypothetical protein [Arthrobacter sp. FW306-04-A]|uniref:hypothetical protein n=1 Tax=Arthrobacter sp. FW306-04-A TaxID=2879619 RepID=UPI0037C0793A|nr:hypothetical protein LFT43_15705 [Arthrobacter sp. FW306-04-A]